MDPKDEIQKLIQTEMDIWAEYETKNKNFRISQVDRFKPLRILLEELVSSIEPEYVQSTILDDQATIEISNETACSSCIKWTIQPNFKTLERHEEYWAINLWQKKINLEQAPGFKVEEKRGDGSDHNSEFGTENELILYLAQKIAKRIAYYRYTKGL